MLRGETQSDFVIAIRHSCSLKDIVALVFESVGLVWLDHIVWDSSLYRPLYIAHISGDPAKANRVLGWFAATQMRDIVFNLVSAESSGR